MQILLINTNPVVSRLISLCTRENDIQLTEISSTDEIENNHFDLVFIDDAVFSSLSEEKIKSLHANKMILLSSKDDYSQSDLVDDIVKKPFLPSQILNILESLKVEDEYKKPETIPSAENTDVQSYTNEILDLNEVEKIKLLLEMDEGLHHDEPEWNNEEELERLKREVIKQNLIDEGLEIIEDDIMDVIESDLSLSITHNYNAQLSEQKAFEEKLLEAVSKMKIKKIKKLLKGATITINIQFKDETDA